MSFTCMNCGTSLATGSRLCPQCGLLFALPVPTVQAPHVMPSFLSLNKKANRSWFALLLVMSIGFMGLMISGCGTHSSDTGGSGSSSGGSGTGPPPPPPPPVSRILVGSWASDLALNGSPIHQIYTFNSDGTFLETDTNQAGKSSTSSGNYTYVDDQVTINSSDGQQEQATVTWDDPNQIHYKITKNNDASQVNMDIVRTRQAQVATSGTGTQTPPAPPPSSAINVDVIAQAYQDNLLRANQLYEGKVLTFVGKTDSDDDLITGLDSGATLVLTSNVGEQRAGSDGLMHRYNASFLCHFSEENKGQLTSVNKGDVVTIQGTREGATNDYNYISFKDCRIISKP